jgi:hypothetical protein
VRLGLHGYGVQFISLGTACLADSHLCCLTFELSRHQRWDARPGPQKMYTVPVARAWWPAVGARLERGVRRHFSVRHERSRSDTAPGTPVMSPLGVARANENVHDWYLPT